MQNDERKVIDQICCPSCEGDHWIDVYEEGGKFYTLCFGVDIEPYQLTDYDIKYWNINPKATHPMYEEIKKLKGSILSIPNLHSMLYPILLIIGGLAGCLYEMRIGFGLVVLALIFRAVGWM